MDLGVHVLGDGRRLGRVADRLHDRELGHGPARHLRQPVLGFRPGLVRRRGWRRAGRGPVGVAAWLARLEAGGPGLHPAGDGLRDRARRLPALGRRRLRHPQQLAVGDGVSERNRADARQGPSDADLRNACDGHRRARLVALPRPLDRRAPVRAVPGAGGRRALPRRVHPPQQRRGARADLGAALVAGHGCRRDRARRACATGAAAPGVSRRERGGVRRLTHLWALSAFAVAAPLFAKLGPVPGYFAAHGVTSTEIVLLAVALFVVPWLVLVLVEAIARIAGRRVRWIVHLLLVAGLAFLIALPPLGGLT